jgi:hypothetical protein
MKVSELTGAALDWAVAKASEPEVVDGYIVNESFMTRWTDDECEDGVDYHYSTNWAQGGPIIEREGISVATDDVEPWCGFIEDDETNTLFFSGPTPLIAAMRCYVASKMGDEIELPEEVK